jgi:hypothetical protein
MLSFFSGPRMRAGVKLVCALGAIAVAAACGDDDGVDPFSTRRVGHQINALVARTNVAQDDTVTVVPTITDQETGDTLVPTYTFRSTVPSVATVDASTGLVEALLPGTTMIIASARFNDSTYADTVTLTVNNSNRVVSAEILTPDTTLFEGGTKTLVTRLRNPTGTVLATRAREFESLDEDVATVDEEGTVTAVGAGTTRIVLSSEGFADTITVIVVRVPISTIEITPNPASVNQGGTVQLTAHALDEDDEPLTGRTFLWASDNPAVATVNPTTGLVTGIAGLPGGNAVTIRATSEGVTGFATVVVKTP